MPRIAEIKVIDEALWVRIELPGDPSGIGIYTPDEIEHIRHDERVACRYLIEQTDIPAAFKFRAVDALR